ncbi:hypothetical protein B0H19DRAFT_1058062 [Mycena capillaripes]|nr:hypothetical protein B0H19DRAFT_1058062 [Mycena capillaripes]
MRAKITRWMFGVEERPRAAARWAVVGVNRSWPMASPRCTDSGCVHGSKFWKWCFNEQGPDKPKPETSRSGMAFFWIKSRKNREVELQLELQGRGIFSLPDGNSSASEIAGSTSSSSVKSRGIGGAAPPANLEVGQIRLTEVDLSWADGPSESERSQYLPSA